MLCLPFNGKSPELKSGARIAPNATIVGDVTVEKGASVFYGAVLRGDVGPIHVGEDTNLQDQVLVHAATTIGSRVSVGHGAIVHGCTIEDDCLIGMGAILMDRAVIGHHSLVGAGALVTGGTVIPPYSLVLGSPAKVIRPLKEHEIADIEENSQEYLETSLQLEVLP